MLRKSSNPNFDQTLDLLRSHSFDVAPQPGIADSVLVSKYGAAAVIAPAKDAPAAFVERPGALIRGEVARLVDRGYQKFLVISKYELPATAGQLEAIHRFSEELKQLTGAISLYNESLGTTSDLYQYDRLKGRETALPEPMRPWDTAESH
jgi:hypothetical protein